MQKKYHAFQVQSKDFEIFRNYQLFYLQNLDITAFRCRSWHYKYTYRLISLHGLPFGVSMQTWELNLIEFTVLRKSINSVYTLSIRVEHARWLGKSISFPQVVFVWCPGFLSSFLPVDISEESFMYGSGQITHIKK